MLLYSTLPCLQISEVHTRLYDKTSIALSNCELRYTQGPRTLADSMDNRTRALRVISQPITNRLPWPTHIGIASIRQLKTSLFWIAYPQYAFSLSQRTDRLDVNLIAAWLWCAIS